MEAKIPSKLVVFYCVYIFYFLGAPVPVRWIVAGICLEDKVAFVEGVTDRSAATLIPIIERHIQAGSTIITDEWASYRSLASRGFVHKTVNHSVNYVDPVTHACTNGVEGFWSVLKSMFFCFFCVFLGKLRFILGSQGSMQNDHLQELVYRYNHGWNKSTGFVIRFTEFIKDMNLFYNVATTKLGHAFFHDSMNVTRVMFLTLLECIRTAGVLGSFTVFKSILRDLILMSIR